MEKCAAGILYNIESKSKSLPYLKQVGTRKIKT
jgi:hypothetical protein